MNFARATPSLPRRRVLTLIAATVVAGALRLALPSVDASARPDFDEDGRGDIVIQDTDNDGRAD